MRKRSTYRARPKTPPMLVNRGMVEKDIETRERMLVEAFAGGWAGTNHYDELTDMRNVLVLAAAHKDDQQTLGMCDAMSVVLRNARDRYAKTKRMGVTGDELQLLRTFCDVYRDFWMRQSVQLYLMACDSLNRAHEMGLVKMEPEDSAMYEAAKEAA